MEVLTCTAKGHGIVEGVPRICLSYNYNDHSTEISVAGADLHGGTPLHGGMSLRAQDACLE